MNVFLCLPLARLPSIILVSATELILSHNLTHKSDLPANDHLQEIP